MCSTKRKGTEMEILVKRLTKTCKSPLSEEEMHRICLSAKAILGEEPTLIQIQPPISIAGDLHGQFQDLLRLFDHNGYPPKTRYLFLGDYVDRGRRSTETVALLLAYKVLYPDCIFLLRGNHEDRLINKMYGFYDECKRRYSLKLWKVFEEVFDLMPLAALVGDPPRIFCMHGGLSPHLYSFNQIREIAKPLIIPKSGLACDLVWSDPAKIPCGWAENMRCISFVFAPDVVAQFCKKQEIDLIVRAHQVVANGYQFFANRRLVTVFSAPNYCGEFLNDAAVLNVRRNMECSFSILRPSKCLFLCLSNETLESYSDYE